MARELHAQQLVGDENSAPGAGGAPSKPPAPFFASRGRRLSDAYVACRSGAATHERPSRAHRVACARRRAAADHANGDGVQAGGEQGGRAQPQQLSRSEFVARHLPSARSLLLDDETEAALSALEAAAAAKHDEIQRSQCLPAVLEPLLARADELFRRWQPDGWRIDPYLARLMNAIPLAQGDLVAHCDRLQCQMVVRAAEREVERRTEALRRAVAQSLAAAEDMPTRGAQLWKTRRGGGKDSAGSSEDVPWWIWQHTVEDCVSDAVAAVESRVEAQNNYAWVARRGQRTTCAG